MITRNNGKGSRCSIPVITFTRRLSVAPSCNGNSKLHETLGCTVVIKSPFPAGRSQVGHAYLMRRQHVEGRKGKERKGCPGCYVAAATHPPPPFNSPSFYPLIPRGLHFRGGESLLGLKSRAATTTRNSPCNWPIMRQSDFQP